MKNKLVLVLLTIALLSLSTAGVGKAYAYFTAYTQAAGSHEVKLGDETELEEKVRDGNKEITIKNSDTSNQAVYVRARAFAGSEIESSLNYSGEGWSKGEGGWWYYSTPLLPGETAEKLLIEVSGRPADDTEIFKVTVVYESTPAIQNGVDADGNIKYEPANWHMNEGGGE